MNIDQKIISDKRVYLPWRSCKHCKFYKDIYHPLEKRYVCFYANVCKNAIEIHADETDLRSEND